METNKNVEILLLKGEYTWKKEFFSAYQHKGVCVEEETGKEFGYLSELALKAKCQRKRSTNFKFDVPAWLNRYCFKKCASDKQSFAVAFGAWMGLDKSECKMIANKKNEPYAFAILNALLLNAKEKVKRILKDKNTSSAQKLYALDQIHPFEYVVIVDEYGSAKAARYVNVLCTEKCGRFILVENNL